MAIRTDRPAPPPPKPATPPPAGPPPLSGADAVGGTSRVDGTSDIDGVEGIEDIAQQSLDPRLPSSLNTGTAAALSASSTSKTAAPTTAKTSEPGQITAMLEGAVGKLAPGQSVKVGGTIGVGEGLVVEGGTEVEITRREDNGYDVTIKQEGLVGVGSKAAVGRAGEAEAVAGVTIGREMTFKVATLDDAVELGAEVVGFGVAGGALPIPMGGELGLAAATFHHRNEISATKVSLGGALTLEIESKLDDSLKAALGTKNNQSASLVYEAPDKYFVELEVSGEFSAGGIVDADPVELGVGGELAGKMTLKIPVGVPDPALLSTEAGREALLKSVATHAKQATISVEGTMTATSLMGDTPVTAKKTVNASDIATLFGGAGWEVEASIAVGPTIKATIGVAEVEVGAQRSITVWEHKGGTLAQELKTVNDNKAAIEKQAIKEDPKRGMPR
jgi:hypothetical protein